MIGSIGGVIVSMVDLSAVGAGLIHDWVKLKDYKFDLIMLLLH